MNDLAIIPVIPPMSESAIECVREFESHALAMPQVDMPTAHVLHGGMYARTIMIPAGVMITGGLIKIATMLIVQGDVLVYIGDRTLELHGYNVLPASQFRKQAFLAQTDTHLTMIFPTSAQSVERAEEQFTDDADMLISRKDGQENMITITGG